MKGKVTFANGWSNANSSVFITIAPTAGGVVVYKISSSRSKRSIGSRNRSEYVPYAEKRLRHHSFRASMERARYASLTGHWATQDDGIAVNELGEEWQ